MNLYAPISFFKSSRGSSQGTPISLAEFMAMGKDFAPQIMAYRSLKQTIRELNAERKLVAESLQHSRDVVSMGINPLDPDSEIEYQAAVQSIAQCEQRIADFDRDIESGNQEADRIKRGLPAATLSGYFAPKRKEADLQQHSGFICIDIDDHFNRKNAEGKNVSFPQSLDHVMEILQQIPWVVYAAHSVGGVGYFALIPLGPVETPQTLQTPQTPQTLRTHKWYFECLEEEFREYGLIIDPACSDVTRLRIISYDPEPYRNPHAVPYMGRHGFIGREEKKQREDEARRAAEAAAYRARLNKSSDDVLRDVEACVQQIEQRALDITQNYLTTVKIGMSLYSLGDSGLYLWKRICRFRSADHAHLRTDRDLEQRWRTFGTGKSVPVEWFFKYLIDTSSPEYGHPAWTVFAHPRRH